MRRTRNGSMARVKEEFLQMGDKSPGVVSSGWCEKTASPSWRGTMIWCEIAFMLDAVRSLC